MPGYAVVHLFGSHLRKAAKLAYARRAQARLAYNRPRGALRRDGDGRGPWRGQDVVCAKHHFLVRAAHAARRGPRSRARGRLGLCPSMQRDEL